MKNRNLAVVAAQLQPAAILAQVVVLILVLVQLLIIQGQLGIGR
jgi:hypothetical protein